MKNFVSKFAAAIALGVIAASHAPQAQAGRVDAQDAPAPDKASSNYQYDGQFWQQFELTNDTSRVGSINGVPLNLQFGSFVATQFEATTAGTISFYDSNDTYLGYITPLAVPGGYNTSASFGHYTNGLLDPAYLTAVVQPYDGNGNINSPGLQSFRFAWENCPNRSFDPVTESCPDSKILRFQVLIIEVNANDWMLQLNYLNSAGAIPVAQIGDPLPASASLRIGDNAPEFITAANSPPGTFIDRGPNFCFRAGFAVDCSLITGEPSVVAEPDAMLLAAAGAAALAFTARRKRRPGRLRVG